VTTATQQSHKSRTAGIVVVVFVIIILAAGFVVYIPATSTHYTPVDIVNTEEITFATSSTTAVPISQPATSTQPVFVTSDISLKPTYYDAHPATLTVGTDVQVSWQASESVNVYIFSSTEFNTYAASNGATTSPNLATDSAASGGLAFHIAGTDTYYLVIENPNNGLFGIGSSNVGYTTTGSETFPTTTTTYITQTVTYSTSTQTVVTSTSTSTTTSTCSHYLWSWLGGAKSCP